MNNLWFVYYDVSEKIVAITNEKLPEGNYFEVPEKLIIDFNTGLKNYNNYRIRIKNFKDFIIEEVITEKHFPVFKDLFFIPKYTDKDRIDLCIEQSTDGWKFSLKEKVKKEVLISQLDKSLRFYFCSKYDYNYLLRKVEFKISELVENNLFFNFENDKEKNLSNLEIITRKYFDKTGVLECLEK